MSRQYIFRKSTILLLLFLLMVNPFRNSAQSTIDFRINEILTYNDSSYTDEYGMHVPWIEIFNSAYNYVNLSGLFFTNDLNNPRKYFIPKGDPRTKVPPRGYVIFFADNKTERGVFHLNFGIEENGVIALFDSDGETLIDSVRIPPVQVRDITYGRLIDGMLPWSALKQVTPAAGNRLHSAKSSGDIFSEYDPSGIGLTIIAMSVVFLALFLLYFIYKWIGYYFTGKFARSGRHVKSQHPTGKISEGGPVSGEVNAAIVMAIHLYISELHDIENPVLTIQKVSRIYSPWSSKIYSLRKQPNR
jgi:Na+-transporting methylmalonyl-CoA/oxaloacetate decarboxylase gamma subunit